EQVLQKIRVLDAERALELAELDDLDRGVGAPEGGRAGDPDARVRTERERVGFRLRGGDAADHRLLALLELLDLLEDLPLALRRLLAKLGDRLVEGGDLLGRGTLALALAGGEEEDG